MTEAECFFSSLHLSPSLLKEHVPLSYFALIPAPRQIKKIVGTILSEHMYIYISMYGMDCVCFCTKILNNFGSLSGT